MLLSLAGGAGFAQQEPIRDSESGLVGTEPPTSIAGKVLGQGFQSLNPALPNPRPVTYLPPSLMFWPRKWLSQSCSHD